MKGHGMKEVQDPAGPPAPPLTRPRILLETLLGNSREIVIIHGREEYVLRLTRNGKLILTK
jgi:hemin uptake protein HemP